MRLTHNGHTYTTSEPCCGGPATGTDHAPDCRAMLDLERQAEAGADPEAAPVATARPKRLRNGRWGVQVASDTVRSGDRVAVQARNGKSWEAVISRVYWSGNGQSIASTRRAA